ncbi:MAG: 2-dehydropantoate 2-reductase, partial [Rhodospirillaceae bacterium]|nr:2-dehydropantoate 2-reductase [Rhodospirillaceae bacterium]
MKIAVMAAGGVGGYFGARLAAAGGDVHFIARGAHLEAIRQNGLKLESPLGDLHIKDAQATDDPATVGVADVVLFAVKLWDSEAAAKACTALIGPDTIFVTFQNGIDGVSRLTPILGAKPVVGGVTHISSFIGQPGTIRHNGDFARLQFGEADGGASPRLAAFLAACEGAGIKAKISPDIELAQWQKFVFLVGLSGATGVTRQSIGPILADPDCRQMLVSLMEETAAVGRARGIALAADFAHDRLAYAEALPAHMKASMLNDLQQGKRLELDWLSGEVVRLGRQLAIPTPTNDAVYAALKPLR